MIDKNRLKKLAEAAVSPVWLDNPLTDAYYEEKDYDLICGYNHDFEHCRVECFEVRGRIAKEKAISEFIAAMNPNTVAELGWEEVGYGPSAHQLLPTKGPWFCQTEKVHRSFNAPPSFAVFTGVPTQGWHKALGSRVCSVKIRKKFYWLETSGTVGKAEYEWANSRHIKHFSPEFVLENL